MSEELSLNDAMDATLRETYASATADAPDPVIADDAPTETAAQKADRIRDESGRFAKAGEPVATDAPVEAAATDPAPVDPVVEAKQAPGSWPKEVREKFAELPADVQDYVTRRESEVNRTINQYSQKAKAGEAFLSVLNPYMGILQADGADPVGAVDGLMKTYTTLRNASPHDKAMAVAQLVQRFGVDLSLLSEDGQQAGNYAQQDSQLYNKVAQLEQELANRRIAEQNAEQSHVSSLIADFQQKAPHFETVKAHMGALLQAGLAKDMQDAYDQAVMAHPEIRATLLQEQESKRREDAARAAAAAKKASAVNVAARGIQPAARPVGTMEDTMREAYRRATGQ